MTAALAQIAVFALDIKKKTSASNYARGKFGFCTIKTQHILLFLFKCGDFLLFFVY